MDCNPENPGQRKEPEATQLTTAKVEGDLVKNTFVYLELLLLGQSLDPVSDVLAGQFWVE